MIIICINDSALINDIYGRLEDLTCSSEFP